ncbi:MAG: (Na+)-NQR maturation NqrM [bacterium]
MQIFIITFVVLLLAVAGMALGVIFSGRRIHGSCGGVGNSNGGSCACADPCAKRKKREAAERLGATNNS